jgi:hypothetical protein
VHAIFPNQIFVVDLDPLNIALTPTLDHPRNKTPTTPCNLPSITTILHLHRRSYERSY